ncbi:hypothetical protein AKI39_21620 [Bordetella sp. H567]|uniref:DUF4148 domain-containing protein n=1 Tax=Bordetella sp. H567 TaxID=1697043 RepID=UPI00081C5CF1|nr:DUF4148 domain-containing protein [Bordetella sp. H567]AOB32778.1 hypothetical protein AKI39_21620 [Bordetella sp. H567]
MKIKTIACIVSSFTAIGGAHAAGTWNMSSTAPFPGVYGRIESSPSRAQVQAELQQARAAGLLSNGDMDNVPFDGIYGRGGHLIISGKGRGEPLHARAAGSTGNEDIDNEPFHGD